MIASMAGVVPSPGQAAYSAAKAGVRAYFASVAAELADKWVAKWGRGRGPGELLCVSGGHGV